ncbi:spermidine/putrescine ABC transporter ATP-binding protein [Bacillus toyonensis]|nr:spermidine/putrescine ABC transporter ATP-binding protein [Bacillus toyonensis]QWI08374.1 spermidine/putrescine ABC transporter ATP-binding protein [Bacillus toyonensis]TBX41737.1 spermidine/putrescine ABC transporter ATP-binding protein [Bacillus toyonensis]
MTYPALTGSKLPPIPARAKRLGGKSTACKCPIGEG